MTPQEVDSAFIKLWDDINPQETFPQKRPFLAHYTTISTLENIVSNEEFWFSNPLNMSDISEVRFGALAGVNAFRNYHDTLRRVCKTQERFEILSNAFEGYFHEFDSSHVLDTYVLCLTNHDPQDTDGRLSMWRAYGGNGNGAAIIIDTSKINALAGVHPLIFSDVKYCSEQERDQWINQTLIKLAEIIDSKAIPDELLYVPAFYLFERLKIFALFSKHSGFKEEDEWRAVYLAHRDISNIYGHMLGYASTKRGIELKFKYKVKPIPNVTAADLSLEKIIHQIILGPSQASYLALNSTKRMLQMLGKPALADRVIASNIPFRPL